MKISIITAIAATLALWMTSCTVTTAPDGAVTKAPNWEAWNPFVELVKEYYPPPVAPIVIEPSK